MARPRPVPPYCRVVEEFGLGEFLEQGDDLALRDADAGVGDREPEAAGVGRLEARRHPAGVGELDGVGDQVGEYLAQPVGVAAPRASRLRRDLDRKIQPLVLGDGREAVTHRLGHPLDVEVLLGQLQLARLDLGEVEHVVQHRQQLLARLAHHVKPLALHIGEVAALHHLGHRQHTVQRRADLVAHVGQELRLGDVGRVGRVARLHQVFERLAEFAVVGVDLGEQVVEGVGEPLEDVVIGDVRIQRTELAAGGHLSHRLGEPLDRRGDAARQAVGHEERDAAGPEEQRAGQCQEARQQRDQRRLMGAQHHLAEGAAVHHDRCGLGVRRSGVQGGRAGRGEIGHRAAVCGDEAHVDQIMRGGRRGDVLMHGGHVVRRQVRRGGGGHDAGKRRLLPPRLLSAHAPLLQHEG